jgi:hypothetical protein
MRQQRALCATCGHRFAACGELSEELEIEFSATFDHVVPRFKGGAGRRR